MLGVGLRRGKAKNGGGGVIFDSVGLDHAEPFFFVLYIGCIFFARA